jgi:SAM-dependent methyltransferase
VPELWPWGCARLRRIERALRYGGRRYACPLCGSTFRHWWHKEQVEWLKVCPMCYSQPRTRLLVLWMRRETDMLAVPRAIVHVAPEDVLRDLLAAVGHRYVTVDLQAPRVDVRADLSQLPLREAVFDVAMCNHVLEHVTDDRRCMRELRRVLRPGGTAVVMVPYQPDRVTIEDPSITDPARRTELFGQADHVRLYGRDFVDRLDEAGFDVSCSLYWKTLGEEAARRFGLQRDEYLIVGRARP